MNYENLIDYSIDTVIGSELDNKIFPSKDTLSYLDDYIISNLNRGLSTSNKDYLLKVSKLIVNSLGFLERASFKDCQDLKIRWLAFSDICEKFLETKSLSIAHQEIIKTHEELKRYGYSDEIIKELYLNKVLKVSDIEKLLGSKKQYASNLIKKFENLGVLTKSAIGKNKLIRLTSIGIEIYKIYLKDFVLVEENKTQTLNNNDYKSAYDYTNLKNEVRSNNSNNHLPLIAFGSK